MSKEGTERIEQRAGEWLARRDSNDWSTEQEAELERWLEESLEHRVAWLRLLETWESSLRLRALGAGPNSELPPPGQWNLSPFFSKRASRATERSPGGSRPGFRALAASVLLACVLSAAWFLWPRNIYETPVGGLASVPIADGSRVLLNTDSQIEVAITATERRIELKHGEAFFDVAKDPNRPFIVAAGGRRIIAVGTAFAVRRDGEDVQVVVTEGVVRVESAKRLRSAEKHDAAASVLTPGSIARFNEDAVLAQTNQLLDAEERIAWRSGTVVFRDVTLAEAVAEFNRYNTRKIVIKDPAATEYTVGGSFSTVKVEAFLRLLERAYPIRVHFEEDVIVLTAR
ncbi:FecR family protein [Steroidobacter sp.]|uniref:FecR family protein n=1 Tax=Steroidobacter sp. TaxID=1978227 RepID=UPI001A5D6258|nr:FecR domain-containing protein [Steroidobacter sp.]MBL8271989.1 FecR domain-containing protein [Steroidobacter sp.]